MCFDTLIRISVHSLLHKLARLFLTEGFKNPSNTINWAWLRLAQQRCNFFYHYYPFLLKALTQKIHKITTLFVNAKFKYSITNRYF